MGRWFKMKEKDIVYIDNVAIGKVNSCEPIGYQMNDIFALTAYDWEFTEHYLYNMRDIPNKEDLDDMKEFFEKEIKVIFPESEIKYII